MEKLKIGMFGLGIKSGVYRGVSYIRLMMKEPRIEVVAVCDWDVEKSGLDKELPDAGLFTDFDEFIAYGKTVGMSAVFLCNFYPEHAYYAVKAMENGMDIISECTAAGTLKECVELVEAVERTGRKYMLAENYPFSLPRLKMDKIIKAGKLGTLLYAEGEYNHSGKGSAEAFEARGIYHWRGYLPRTYYATHALGPLMYMSGSMPKYISARTARSGYLAQQKEFRHVLDGTGMLFCEMDNGMIARFTGCTGMASDYSRYRICGDIAGVESGAYLGDPNSVRLIYQEYTVPEGEQQIQNMTADPAEFGERGVTAVQAGHGGGDYWILQIMLDYFLDGVEPFFDVYRGAAMSACEILGWRSALNHGENFRIPDFRNSADRDLVRNDALTPFPDQNGNGITLPCTLPDED